MDGYTIGETAKRTGFSASALRYYERIGLVEPASRTDAGYRRYDDGALSRLAFIARAKQLGCSLEEITDLLAIWEGRRCGPVQRRFHGLVTEKIRDAHDRVAELTAFAAQLQRAAEQLSAEPGDGPCDANCACLLSSVTPTGVTAHVTLDANPAVPIACTLEPASLPDRFAAWAAMLAAAHDRSALADGGMRIELGAELDLGELARLIAAEHHCCAFFSFALIVDQRGIGLEVRAPEGADRFVTDLFADAAIPEPRRA